MIGQVLRSPSDPDRAYVRLDDAYVAGANGLDRFSHLFILHALPATPVRLDGVFARRGDPRPAPIGIAVVELLHIEDELLTVAGLDAPEGTAVLDIQPYDPRRDAVPGAVT